jgi:YYY domain-containing protein
MSENELNENVPTTTEAEQENPVSDSLDTTADEPSLSADVSADLATGLPDELASDGTPIVEPTALTPQSAPRFSFRWAFPQPKWYWLWVVFVLLVAGFFRFSGLDLNEDFSLFGLNWDQNTHNHPDERFLTMVTSAIQVPGDFGTFIDTKTSSLSPYNRGFGFYVYGTAPIFITRCVGEAFQAINPDPRTPAEPAPGQPTVEACRGLTSWLVKLPGMGYSVVQNSDGTRTERLGLVSGLVGTKEQPGFFYRFGTGYDEITYVGRFLSACFDLASVFLIFLIGKRAFNWRVGVLAAFFAACAPALIQQAKFYTVDSFANLFVTSAILWAVSAMRTPKLRYFVLFGISLGLSMASKINTLFLAFVLMAVVGVHIQQASYLQLGWSAKLFEYLPITWKSALRKMYRQTASWVWLFAALSVAGLLTILVFRIMQAYAFDGFGLNQKWLDNMSEVQRMMVGDVNFPPDVQWANRPAYIFPLENMLRWGMGMVLGITVWLAVVVAVVSLFRTRNWKPLVVPVFWTVIYFGYLGQQWVKPMRYFLPVYPTLVVLGAWLLIRLWDSASKQNTQEPSEVRVPGGSVVGNLRHYFEALLGWLGNGWVRLPVLVRQIFTGGILLGVAISSFIWAFAFHNIYRQPMSRVQGSRWIYENVGGPINLQYLTNDGEIRNRALSLPYNFRVGADGAQVRNAVDYEIVDPMPITENNLVVGFGLNKPMTVTSIYIPFLGDPLMDADTETIEVRIARFPDGTETLSTVTIEQDLAQAGNARGQAYTLPLSQPLQLDAANYYVLVRALNGTATLDWYRLANEGAWDDPVPMRMDGYDPFGGLYRGLEMQMVWDDNPAKVDRMATVLAESDYLVISSNRFYDSQSRIPTRWPFTIAYYQALFSGELGMELVQEYELGPQIGNFRISDQASEEPFTVYDHPKVWIFRRTENFTPENLQKIAAGIDFTQVTAGLSAKEYTKQLSGKNLTLMLPEERLAQQQAGGTWSELFWSNSPLNRNQLLGTVAWWLFAVLLGLVAFPLAFTVLHGLPEKGYAVSKMLGLIVLAWSSWLLASVPLLPFTRLTLWLVFLLLLAVSGVLAWVQRATLLDWLKRHWRYMLTVEAVFLLFFLFDLLIRLYNPDLWHPSYGGEKPMDFSYFNAVLRSTSFPPYDPWFSGGYLNYYYFGFVIAAVPTKLLGIVPAFAYNLILPLLFALVASGAFCVAYNLTAYYNWWRTLDEDQVSRKANAYLGGILAALMMVVLGNLGQIKTLARAAELAGGGADGWRKAFFAPQEVPMGTGSWYWDASRLIPVPEGEVGPITEFPLFTFIYADLHAHMLVMPLTLLALAWAVSFALATPESRKWWQRLVVWLSGGVIFGAIYPTNTWDYPGYLALACAAILFANYRKQKTLNLAMLFATAWQSALFFALTRLTFQPYHQWFGLGYSKIEIWDGSRTALWAYLGVHGLFLFAVVSLLIVETYRWLSTTRLSQVQSYRQWLVGGGVVALAGLVMGSVLLIALWQVTIAPLVLLLLFWTAYLLLLSNPSPELRVMYTIIGLALSLTLAVEIIRLGGDIGRMNTVFKFYLQAWGLFVTVSGAAYAILWARSRKWDFVTRIGWRYFVVFLLALAALYPLTAIPAKMKDRMSNGENKTLDGMAYMQYARYADQGQEFELQYDYEAIRWLQENVVGSPVIVEAHTVEYRYGARIAINTGLPAVLGWNWHQRQQRAILSDRLVWQRVDDIKLFYDSVDTMSKETFISKYNVSYIIVGAYERLYYNAQGLDYFEQMVQDKQLEVVFANEGTKIYRVLAQTGAQ